MKIYADTSFLVSLLYPGDAKHRAAKKFFSRSDSDDWVTTSWSQLETINALRQLCLTDAAPKEATIEAIRRLFKHWHEHGSFLFEKTEADVAINDAAQISAAKGAVMKIRSADLLHVALLEQINPDLFVTRDREQYELATQRAFKSQLIR